MRLEGIAWSIYTYIKINIIVYLESKVQTQSKQSKIKLDEITILDTKAKKYDKIKSSNLFCTLYVIQNQGNDKIKLNNLLSYGIRDTKSRKNN